MKKLTILLLASIFLSFSVFAQENERELSNYEKYILEKEQATVAPDTIYNTDTAYVELQDDRIIENNYYINNTPDIRYGLAFGYSWNYYRYYDPFYSNYYSWGYPNYYPNYYPYYSSYYRPRYNRHANRYGSAGVLGNHRNYNNPSFRTNRSGYATLNNSGAKSSYTRQRPITVNRTVNMDRRSGNVISVQNKSPYNRYVKTSANTRPTQNINRNRTPVERLNRNTVNRSTNVNRTKSGTNINRNRVSVQRSNQNRSYSPSYSKPRMSTRPQYNNSRPSSSSRSYSAPASRSSSSRSYSSGSRSSGRTSASSGARRR